MTRYRLDLVGPFGLFAPDGRRIEISSRKAMALIAVVVSSAGGVRTRRKLESMLWGSRLAKQAQDSLRRELSNLRKVLAAHGAEDLLICETKRVAIAVDRVDVDVFAIGVRVGGSGGRFRGDFLEGMDLPDCEEFEDWLRDERERVREMIENAIAPDAEMPPSPTEVFGGPVPSARDTLGRGRPKLPPKPSVAVLPFAVLGPDPKAWLGAGLADEVGVCLSAFPQLFIVGSGAARLLAERGVERTAIAERLGVRYLLEGTILADGPRMRVNASLVDGTTGEQFWSDTFIGSSDETFAFQQEIAGRIAPQIWTKVDGAERRRSLRLVGPVSGDYERYWRANALFRSWERAAVEEALELTLRLADEDPTCPWSTSLAAYCSSIAYLMRYTPDREATRRRAIGFHQAALRHGADNVEALGYCAGTLMNIGGDLDVADGIVATALGILPAHQPTLFWGGWVDVLRGESERASERFQLALRLNPATGALGQTLAGMGFAALMRGSIEEAHGLFVEAERLGPGFPPTRLGACVAAQMLGRTEEARHLADPLLASGGLELARMMGRPEHRAMLETLLRAAAAEGGPECQRGDTSPT